MADSKTNADPGTVDEPTAAPAGPSPGIRTSHPAVRAALPLLAVLGIAFAFLGGSPAWAVAIIMVALVIGYVLGVAWMRPRQVRAEHHPKIDRFLDDTAP
jgi:hypothetical protein